MDNKENSFMGFDDFEEPVRGEKKLLLKQEKLDSVLKSIYIYTWSPASMLNLKMWILKMRMQQANIFEFLKSCISIWENGWRMNWPPPRNITPCHRNPPPPLKFKIILTFTKNPKFQLSPNLRGVHTMLVP